MSDTPLNSESTGTTSSHLDPKKIRRNKIIFFSLLALPIFSVGLSTFMFKTGKWVPTGTTNRGTLIQPVKQIAPLQMTEPDGTPTTYGKDAKWTFLIPFSKPCEESCQEQLYFTRQVHIAVGKNATALRRFYLNTGPALSSETLEFLAKEHPRLKVVNTDAKEWQAFSQDFVPDQQKKQPFYLVDPSGFVMMAYTKENSYKDILTDLKKLLSGVGGH